MTTSGRHPLFWGLAALITLAFCMINLSCLFGEKSGPDGATLRPGDVAARADLSFGLNKIQHIVFIIKENRTFDNYFGAFPGADGATSGTISTGRVIPPLVRLRIEPHAT